MRVRWVDWGQFIEDFKYQVKKFGPPILYTKRELLRGFEQVCDKNQYCSCKK